MSLARDALTAAIARHGRVVRVLVAATAGSVPREAGAAMLVWADAGGNANGGGQDGTIGGGALEWEAAAVARQMLAAPRAPARLRRIPLGPGLGQCCGGAVTLLWEIWDAEALAGLPEAGMSVRRIGPDAADTPPLSVRRAAGQGRDGRAPTGLVLDRGWLAEPVSAARRPVWIWGAGHVGRAIVSVMSPLPALSLTWLDTAPDRFPEAVPAGVRVRAGSAVAGLVNAAPPEAHHLVLTYAHALDLELCHLILGHGFASCGLIGSATKWARFRKRLAALGHPPEKIARITCPIGDPSLGKHPQEIAIGVAAGFLAGARPAVAQRGERVQSA